ncbi:UvrD-helicase domain-containing protein [Mucilaginibacter sp. AK015]|uniref:UvrD-helicase domain-containing protein n=1 Tax=Mucilaginibacter sp. AK015 TaxID=2723072 RepID=UPI001619F5F4|nr:UvrD-helicase domain-containing protein [Mucilaginibacter sp. AK015]MBB5395060.1 DNA helicase-4 [Mucilaginibacter sp. AK015]
MPLKSLLRTLNVVVFCISIIGIWYVYKEWQARRTARRELPKYRQAFEEALQKADGLLSYDRYFAFYDEQIFRQKYQKLRHLVPADVSKLNLPADLFAIVDRFANVFDQISALRHEYNKEFEEREAKTYAGFFSSLEDYPLSQEQIKAIVRDEDNNLVLAGAGTGKTTTIAGKVAYLLEKKLAGPEELLIISFTKNAVAEMTERCKRFCKGIADVHLLEIRTFNGFGYFVNRHCVDHEIHIAFRGDESAVKTFLQETFDRLFLVDSGFQKKAVNFISFFNRPERDEFEFETTNDFLKHEKSFKNIALDGVEVKSKEELQIANFFCLNSIAYAYEKHYPLQAEDRSANNAAYYPDFYLTAHDIWHEHYGIDKAGNVPKRFGTRPGFTTAKDYYHALMKWKEHIHTKYGTKLIKTFSYESREGRLLASLKKQLTDLNIPLTPRKPEDILEMVRDSPHYQDFLDLIFTFLGLMKANRMTPAEVKTKSKDKRLAVFMGIFEPLYQAYQARLNKASEIDFNDMINDAASHIRKGNFKSSYKYILVDEFQDMSLGRYDLLKSIKAQNPAARLYAVGDDWQSIFRFTGSDISIITDFEKHFGFTSQTTITQTYRFNEQILKISTDFIQRNPKQLRKNLTARHPAHLESFIFKNSSPAGTDIISILEEISVLQADATVFFIGRYHHNEPQKLREIKYRYKGLVLAYHTAHKVKGMTCDYAVLLDLNSAVLGFPSEMADDPLLNHLLNESDAFENAEERRLFYVAITRARHRNYLLADANHPSKFVTELKEMLGVTTQGIVYCPECQGSMVLRKGPFNDFYGCSNYPDCEGKLAIDQ